MNNQTIEHCWLLGLNLSERIVRRDGGTFEYIDSIIRRKHASEKLTWWSEQFNCSTESILDRWCQEFSLTRDEVQDFIGATDKDLALFTGPLPEWFHVLVEIAATFSAESYRSASIPATKVGSLISPWGHWAEVQLSNWAITRGICDDSLLDWKTLHNQLLKSLCDRLGWIAEKTFVLEFNVWKLQDSTTRNSKDGQLSTFKRRLCNLSTTIDILKEYPVLSRILTEESLQWLANVTKILNRFVQDADLLTKFLGSQSIRLGDINMNAGDRHKQGQSVCVFTFCDGTKVVYKPRSQKSDLAILELLSYVNPGTPKRPAVPRVLDRDDYSWSEFIEHIPCKSKQCLTTFYREAGAIIATLFILGGCDFHYENLIACGNQPVLVDLECLFQPYNNGAMGRQPSFSLFDTVLGSALLPSRPFNNLERDNLCGLGDLRDGALAPFPVNISEVGNDDIQIVKKQFSLSRATMANLPCQDEDTGPQHFVQEISDGFRERMRKLLACRHELLASQCWNRFREHRYRCVVWPTMGYGRVLIDSYHPNVLRNAMDREAVFDRIYSRLTVPALFSNAVIPSERADLWAGDIPVFHFDPIRGTLWNSRNRQVFETTESSPMKVTEDRFMEIDENAVERHVWTIATSLKAAATTPLHPDSTRFATDVWKPYLNPALVNECITPNEVVQQIAEHIANLAFVRAPRVFWIDTIQAADKGRPVHYADLVGENLYDGLAGFQLFFHYAARAFKSERFEQLAEKITYSIMDEVEQFPMRHFVMGGFLGWSSALYGLSHRLSATQSGDISRSCRTVLSLIEQSISKDTKYDIIGGCAGTICTLLTYFSVSGDSDAINLAEQCGDHLIASMIEENGGVAWKTISDVALGGFAHGASGIAYSLYRLAFITKKDRFLAVASRALKFERSTYSTIHNNWCDLRPWSTGEDYVAWCIGAPGVGITLASQIQMGFADEYSLQDLERAFNKTFLGAPRSSNVCHGEFGNLDCLHYMALASKRSDWIEKVKTRSSVAVLRAMKEGLAFDAASQSLGLMLGLAGVGLTLLRLSYPEQVPSFLALAPPIVST